MIYTVTFNPALDYIMRMDQPLQIGETNRSGTEDIFYGGKGINVSRVLCALGEENTALGFAAGFTGKVIEEELKKLGIKTDFIFVKNGFSRINVKIKGEKETEINACGPKIDGSEVELLFEKIHAIEDGDYLVLAGSIPGSLPNDIYEKILEKVSRKQVHTVVDATGSLLRRTLCYHPFLIKPNRQELSDLFNVNIKTDEETVFYARELQKEGAENVLVSMGGEGSILIDREQNACKLPAFFGVLRNSTGAGDSMVAGFLAGYKQTGNMETAFRLGSAAGSATAFHDDLATREQIYEVYNSSVQEMRRI
ncbi:MAG: 1-phosphofructokinase [Clostridia bacterium]|nr:1-phosphofructokinase [Clostridia bacterium]MDY5554045.1 1-phosphofructokinase [Blautia sp.]